uniref:DUF834 domain-containing protein n=1 Tax=Oryza barthii TaxID=65489 RepID=A0A0D3F8U5_9ORYZ
MSACHIITPSLSFPFSPFLLSLSSLFSCKPAGGWGGDRRCDELVAAAATREQATAPGQILAPAKAAVAGDVESRTARFEEMLHMPLEERDRVQRRRGSRRYWSPRAPCSRTRRLRLRQADADASLPAPPRRGAGLPQALCSRTRRDEVTSSSLPSLFLQIRSTLLTSVTSGGSGNISASSSRVATRAKGPCRPHR